MAITISGSTTNIVEAAVGTVTLVLSAGTRVTGVGGRHQVVATGGTGPYSFEVLAGKLPPGMGFSSDGTFTAAPSARGTFRLLVRATDSSNPAQCVDAFVNLVVA